MAEQQWDTGRARSRHNAGGTGSRSRGDERRRRNDAGQTRSGCGCGGCALWLLVGLLANLVLFVILALTVPVSLVTGSDGMCGDKTVVRCATDWFAFVEDVSQVMDGDEVTPEEVVDLVEEHDVEGLVEEFGMPEGEGEPAE